MWFRQLRRLAAYARHPEARQSGEQVEQRVSIWSAIFRAQGFELGFQTWWPTRSQATHAEISCVPQLPPCQAVACSIRDAFQREVTAMEQAITRERHQGARQRRIQNPNLIFQDIARERAKPVDILQKCETAKVDPTECAVLIDKNIRWDAKSILCIGGTSPSAPHCGGRGKSGFPKICLVK